MSRVSKYFLCIFMPPNLVVTRLSTPLLSSATGHGSNHQRLGQSPGMKSSRFRGLFDDFLPVAKMQGMDSNTLTAKQADALTAKLTPMVGYLNCLGQIKGTGVITALAVKRDKPPVSLTQSALGSLSGQGHDLQLHWQNASTTTSHQPGQASA